ERAHREAPRHPARAGTDARGARARPGGHAVGPRHDRPGRVPDRMVGDPGAVQALRPPLPRKGAAGRLEDGESLKATSTAKSQRARSLDVGKNKNLRGLRGFAVDLKVWRFR